MEMSIKQEESKGQRGGDCLHSRGIQRAQQGDGEEMEPGHSGSWKSSRGTVARICHLKWESNKLVIQKQSLGH